MSDSLWPHGLYSPWNSPGQDTGVGSLSLLQGIFPTQESNPGLSHCRWILYQLSHEGSPKILKWVAVQNSVRKGMKLGIHLWEPEPQVRVWLWWSHHFGRKFKPHRDAMCMLSDQQPQVRSRSATSTMWRKQDGGHLQRTPAIWLPSVVTWGSEASDVNRVEASQSPVLYPHSGPENYEYRKLDVCY